MRNVFNLFSSFPFSFVFRFVLHNKVSNLLNQNGVREKPMSTTNQNGTKGLFIYFELNWPLFVPPYEYL